MLEVDRFYEGYDAFKKADLSDDEKCVVFYTPTNADAADLVEQFRSFAPDTSMLIQVMGDSNQIIVAGAAVDVDRWLQIVQRPMSDDQRPMRRFELKNAQAADVKNIILQLYPAGAVRPVPQPGGGANQPRASAGGGDKVDVFGDAGNALFVKATPRNSRRSPSSSSRSM